VGVPEIDPDVEFTLRPGGAGQPGWQNCRGPFPRCGNQALYDLPTWPPASWQRWRFAEGCARVVETGLRVAQPVVPRVTARRSPTPT